MVQTCISSQSGTTCALSFLDFFLLGVAVVDFFPLFLLWKKNNKKKERNPDMLSKEKKRFRKYTCFTSLSWLGPSLVLIASDYFLFFNSCRARGTTTRFKDKWIWWRHKVDLVNSTSLFISRYWMVSRT